MVYGVSRVAVDAFQKVSISIRLIRYLSRIVVSFIVGSDKLI